MAEAISACQRSMPKDAAHLARRTIAVATTTTTPAPTPASATTVSTISTAGIVVGAALLVATIGVASDIVGG
jgi:arginine/ornithine N-succinyltransferase beta subunit